MGKEKKPITRIGNNNIITGWQHTDAEEAFASAIRNQLGSFVGRKTTAFARIAASVQQTSDRIRGTCT